MRKPASVLPEPVGAATRVCSPAAMGGQAASCAGVGPSGKRSRNQAATAGCSSTDGRSVVSTATPPSSRGSNSDSCVGADTQAPYVWGVTPRIFAPVRRLRADCAAVEGYGRPGPGRRRVAVGALAPRRRRPEVYRRRRIVVVVGAHPAHRSCPGA